MKLMGINNVINFVISHFVVSLGFYFQNLEVWDDLLGLIRG